MGIDLADSKNQTHSSSTPSFVKDEFVVALRTHVWSAAIADVAARLERMAAGCRFVVLADNTGGTLPIEGFDTIFHTDDFASFGLPSFPPNQVLWYNEVAPEAWTGTGRS
jgi:hypothetical protein